jgi:glycosyltransferase 2 family protein
MPAEASWIFGIGAASGVVFGAALAFILMSQRIDLRRFDVIESIAARWDRLVTSVLRGNTATVALCSIGVWTFEPVALGSVTHGFGAILSLIETLMLLGLATLSTLVPTAPGYLGTYQLVFARVFQMFGYPQATGILAANRRADLLFRFGDGPWLPRANIPRRPGHVAHVQLVRPRGSLSICH